jgi:disulfide bond formation protein DsbB
MIPKMPVPDLIRDGNRFSQMIVPQEKPEGCRSMSALTAFWFDTFAAGGYAKRIMAGTAMLERTINLARGQPVGTAAIAIAAIGLAAILGAYFFQYVIGLPPCPLCLEQRIAYYVSIPLAAMVLLGVSVGSSRKVLILALAAIAVAMLWNAGLGVYHSGVEWRWWPGPQDCSGAVPNFSAGGSLIEQMNKTRVVRCDEAAWRFLGLSLAGYNVLISLTLAAIALWGVLEVKAQGSSSESQYR